METNCNDVAIAFIELEKKLRSIDDLADRHWDSLRRYIVNNDFIDSLSKSKFEFREL